LLKEKCEKRMRDENLNGKFELVQVVGEKDLVVLKKISFYVHSWIYSLSSLLSPKQIVGG
jgi:hypothetical protein